MRKLLITGCGRSGTRYTRNVLAMVGVDVGHEAEGPLGTIDWHKAPDVSGYEVVFHQVRHPLRVVESCHTIMGSSWNFICKHDQRVVREEPLLVRCMKYWLYWNRMAQEAARETYRVEDMDKVIETICGALGAPCGPDGVAAVTRVSQNNHTRRIPKFEGKLPSLTWEILEDADSSVASEMMVAAREYGYDLEKNQ